MTLEGSLEITGLELPNFDSTILWRGGQLRVLRMEGNWSNAALVPLHLKFRWHFKQVIILYIGIGIPFLPGSFFEFFLDAF